MAKALMGLAEADLAQGGGSAMNYTPLRLYLIAAMLDEPNGEWSVNRMAEILSARLDAPLWAVREAFFLLMHETLAEPVPFQRALTIRVRTDRNARPMLATLLNRWRVQVSDTGATKEAGAATHSPAFEPTGAKGGDRDDQGLHP